MAEEAASFLMSLYYLMKDNHPRVHLFKESGLGAGILLKFYVVSVYFQEMLKVTFILSFYSLSKLL